MIDFILKSCCLLSSFNLFNFISMSTSALQSPFHRATSNHSQAVSHRSSMLGKSSSSKLIANNHRAGIPPIPRTSTGLEQSGSNLNLLNSTVSKLKQSQRERQQRNSPLNYLTTSASQKSHNSSCHNERDKDRASISSHNAL